MRIKLNLSRKYAILLCITGFVLLLAAIAIPFYSGGQVKEKTSKKRKSKISTIVYKDKGYQKVLPWNNSSPAGEYYFTSLTCISKKAATENNPHIIQATFYGENYSKGFTTNLKFKGKEITLPLKSIGGFSAKRISSSGLGAVLVESKEDGLNCYTTISQNSSNNSQVFYGYDVLDYNTYFDCRTSELDSLIKGSSVLHIQNLRNSEAVFRVLKNGTTEVSFPVNKIPPLGFVSLPLQIEKGALYSLSYFSWGNDLAVFVPSEDLSNGFVAYIEYQSYEDKKDNYGMRNYSPRRYIRSSSKFILPFNIQNGYTTNLTCESPKKETVRIDFKGGNKKSFTTDFPINKTTTKSIKIISGVSKNLGATTGIMEMYLPLATSCKTVIQRGLMSEKVVFNSDDYYSPVPIFYLENYNEKGNLFIYNRSSKPSTFNFLKFTQKGDIIKSQNGLSIEGYGYTVLPITEKDVKWVGLYAQCSPGFPPSRQIMDVLAFTQYKKKRGTLSPLQNIKPSTAPRSVIKGDCSN